MNPSPPCAETDENHLGHVSPNKKLGESVQSNPNSPNHSFVGLDLDTRSYNNSGSAAWLNLKKYCNDMYSNES